MNRRREEQGTAFWLCYTVTALSALISVFYALSALSGEGAGDVYALYAASRSVALVLAVLGVAFVRSSPALVVLALTMSVVQGLDAVIGWTAGDMLKTFGPAFVAVLTLVAAGFLVRARAQPRP